MQIVFVKKKKGCKNFMEKQTDSVETVKSIASDLKAVEPIVSVKNLIVTGKDGRLLVDHLSLQLKRGETLGLVGESGSGKTLTLKSLIGLLPKNLSESYEEKKINGNVAMIFQNPMSALDPLCPVFAQLIEVVMIRQNVSKKEAVCRANELIERLGLPKELSKKDRLPSELSGGQCQRILIAMALACNPDVLLCDEPTTALDVTVQKQTLDLILSLQKEMNFAILFVTHNLAVAAGICSHLAVMHHGKIVERAVTKEILLTPKDEYTKMLLSAILRIPHRCPQHNNISLRRSGSKMQKSDVLLEIRNIQASYKEYPALNNVSLDIKKNTVLGLVGESGSGKSTLAKVITGLLQADTGEVVFDGEMLYSKKKHLHRKQQCKQIQMVFQNPEGSLNPKHTIEKILSDAMLFHKVTDRAHVKEKCQEWVQRMELPEDTLSRFPSSFSGGQKQRIALARALCVSPKFLIADEPTSALDVSVQLRMLQLIKELKREMGLTILFISHDMGVIYDICDEVAVMKDGKIEETGEKKAFFENPKTEYGKLLLDSVPTLPYLE